MAPFDDKLMTSYLMAIVVYVFFLASSKFPLEKFDLKI